ncbi:DUF2490 domain-containing protein [Sphingomonas sp. RT2P30]|uniref:DUF2490 domain-containing protein n=1 Tax=Parasphingomonas halimpatiens TaxID=3096162 RepID=UPI002FC72EDA
MSLPAAHRALRIAGKIGYGAAMRRLALLSAPCLLLAAPAWADGPLQAWPALSVTVPLGGKWSGTAETLARVSRAPRQRANQYRWRLQLARALSSRLTVAVSSGHLVTDNVGRRDGIEDQIVEQLVWTVGKIGPATLTTRTRIEQRFIVGNDGLAWRLREQLRVVAPIGRSPLSAVLWAEPFIALNRTSATRETFDQLRVFAGVSLRVSRHADIEFGYLNQHLHRLSGNVSNDVVPVVLNLHF